MNIFETELTEYAKSVRLTDAEKRSMRAALQEKMHLEPLRGTQSPWSSWVVMSRFAVPSIAVLLICAGTAYAAEGALPGDLLYPIKTNINEPVEVALAVTPQAKAEVEVRLAERRVAEAQTLALRGTLDATTTQELQDNFDTHAAEAIVLAHVSEESGAKMHAAVSASTTLRTAMTENAGAATSTEKENTSLVSVVQGSLDIQATILGDLKLQMERAAKQKETGGHEGNDGHATSTSAVPMERTHLQRPEQSSEEWFPHSSTTRAEQATITTTPPDSPVASSTRSTVRLQLP